MDYKKQLKVLQVFGSLNMGGAESRMMDIYRNLDREACEFDFLTMQTDHQYYEDEITELGGKIIKIDSPRKSGVIKHISTLYKIMKSGKYDAVHAHTSYHCGLVALVAFFARIPVRISHARTTGSKQKSKLKGLFLFFGRSLVNLFSTYKFAISNDAGKFLFGKSKFEVVPNAIDTDKYLNISQDEIVQLKKELKFDNDKLIIGQIGRFDPMKNHEFTLNWFSQFLQIKPDAVLLLVGDGPLRSDMEKLAKELDIADEVVFTGVRGDVPKLIHIFDVLFFPSIFEGLGGVVLEAQAAGVPSVVSTGVPHETNLGLGMVERCSLDSDFIEWNNAILQSLSKHNISQEEILSAFDNAGYSIKAVTEKFINAYNKRTK